MGDVRICMVGAGALGGYMAGRMVEAGFDVTLVDRGPHLDAILGSGLRIVGVDGVETRVPARAVDDCAAVGESDIVFLGVKAHQIRAVAPRLPRLYHDETVVVTLQNGIPWWYFQRHGGRYEGTRLTALDPSGAIARYIPVERVVGCVAYPAATRPAPGVVRLISEGKYPVGEPGGESTDRVRQIADVLEQSGLRTRILADIRAEIWLKALGSVSFNPISALTRSTLVDICTDPETRSLACSMMEEAQHIAHALGIGFRRTIEERIEGAARVGSHKTSMLQDVESRVALETEALVGSIRELGALTGNATPLIDAVYALTKRLGAEVSASADSHRPRDR